MSDRHASPRALFERLGPTYERAGALLSLGLERGWRRRVVDRLAPRDGALYLDVASGTGLVARAVRDRASCGVIALDVTPGMLGSASARDGIRPVIATAERLPFADDRFDGLTFTYLLRYVDDPAATMRELARVVRPHGTIAMLEFARPASLPFRAGWWLYTRIALPVLGGIVSHEWRGVGAFLGPSIDRFAERFPPAALDEVWRAAGIGDVRTEIVGLGAAMVISGRKGATAAADVPDRAASRPAFYALAPGAWRDYWTLLHPPYTAWHLSYVVLGAALAPTLHLERLAGTLAAFFLALGVGVHALDELRSRPLRTRIPDRALAALGAVGIGGAVALGLFATPLVGWGLLAFIAAGAVLALAYPLELARGRLHGDVWFVVGWGAFPLLTAYWVNAGSLSAAALAAAVYAVALSYAQRRLSTWVRDLRRRAVDVRGEVRYGDGARTALDRDALIAAPEAALRWLTVAAVAVALEALAARVL